MNVRFMVYADKLNLLKEAPHPTPWLYGDKLRMVGIKFYDDGALGSRGAWLKRPYSDKPDTRGLQFHSDAEIMKLADQEYVDQYAKRTKDRDETDRKLPKSA